MPDFSAVQNYPDLDFVDTSVEDLLSAAITAYQNTYYSSTGQSITIQPGDDVYILLNAQALREYSILQSINAATRQNFLKYAAGNNLDNLAANNGCTRSPATAAVTTLQFTLGQAQTITIIIPQDTRVTPGNNLYFATDEEVQIAVGSAMVTVTATCLTTGAIGNGYIAGQISTLVDPIAYVSTVTNTETSDGGSDLEDDLSLAEQVFASPEGFSVAGPSGAYDYFARQYSSDIIDTYVSSPSAGAVNMRVLLTGGTLPNTAFLTDLGTYISDDSRRPLTDNFTVAAPDAVSYDINLTYYINSSDVGNVAAIQAAVSTAINNYVLWQQSAIGRDIVPDNLTSAIIGAGAKRVVITSPVFTQIPATSVAIVSETQTITNGGVDGV
jgi:phage-related baseplate assembly protein